MPTLADSLVPPPRSSEEFEDIVLSAAPVRWGSSDFFRNGRSGQAQDGIDIYGHDKRGRHIGVQCKNTPNGLTESLIAREVRKAEAFKPPLSTFYIATTARRDSSIQTYVRKLTLTRGRNGRFRVYVLFWEDIFHDISTRAALIRKHFPHSVQLPRTTRTSRGSYRRWFWTSVKGAHLSLLEGTAATASKPNHFPLATFPSDSTVILGAATTALMSDLVHTSAEWTIPIRRARRRTPDKAYLLVAAIRYFAGLHSRTYDSKAKIELNGNPIDYFGLREIPPHHSDYFHRLPLPDIRLPEEIRECQTIYCWPIQGTQLTHSGIQRVTITIDNSARWDIDYLGLLVRAPKGAR